MISALLLGIGDSEAVSLFRQAEAAYGKMSHFEMSIQHHDDNGLFPGDYVQRLVWKGKGKFSLLVTKGNPKTLTLTKGLKAPDYLSNGSVVTVKWPDGRTTTESVSAPKQMPGWEVSGGFPMMMLERTPSLKRVFYSGTAGLFQWTMGKTRTWNKLAVREVIGTMKNKQTTARIYFDAKRPLILGVVLSGGFNGWTKFYDFKFK
ncbi:MAG: hypothetical protein ABL949_02415 [Fimbriimonadaceae bacterium]